MSAYKEHVTKGPVHILPRDPEKVVSIDDKAGIALMSGYLRDDRQREANASLIAEAFNVLHTSGMTPQELLDAVRELRNALGRMLFYHPAGEDEADLIYSMEVRAAEEVHDKYPTP